MVCLPTRLLLSFWDQKSLWQRLASMRLHPSPPTPLHPSGRVPHGEGVTGQLPVANWSQGARRVWDQSVHEQNSLAGERFHLLAPPTLASVFLPFVCSMLQLQATDVLGHQGEDSNHLGRSGPSTSRSACSPPCTQHVFCKRDLQFAGHVRGGDEVMQRASLSQPS